MHGRVLGEMDAESVPSQDGLDLLHERTVWTVSAASAVIVALDGPSLGDEGGFTLKGGQRSGKLRFGAFGHDPLLQVEEVLDLQKISVGIGRQALDQARHGLGLQRQRIGPARIRRHGRGCRVGNWAGRGLLGKVFRFSLHNCYFPISPTAPPGTGRGACRPRPAPRRTRGRP